MRNESVTNRQYRKCRSSVRKVHAIRKPEQEPANKVNCSDKDAGDSIALYELAGTVHRAKEVGLPLDIFPTLSGNLT